MAKRSNKRGGTSRAAQRTGWQDLAIRAVSAVIYAPLLLALAYFGNPWLLIGMLVLGGLALWEYVSLVRGTGLAVHRVTAGALALGFFLWPYSLIWAGYAELVILPPLFFTLIVLCSLWVLLLPRGRDHAQTFTGWGMAVAGAMYVGWLLGHTVALRDYIYVRGELWLIFALAVTWAYDTGAYLVGRSIGKRRIFQHLSAGKTLEGTLGGAFIAVTVAALYAQFTPFPLSPILAGLIGLATAVVAQLGDLVESLLKRGADAKESGRLIPGHGGVLDRIDSLLFTGPFMFYVALIWASLQLGAQ
ncbi:MAG: phosphatidate cytidylyltransferase [Chloroflexota bacterium]|nr:phosphatidate cytidylyltransferase [Chloroflexota bacterium]MDE2840923.1 phosphatidate cytidylyltransferase [Chloroflexota bacterium]MDE2931384.1 phosphatidate cytidylyltransferase [Chloroflexota bacterium]